MLKPVNCEDCGKLLGWIDAETNKKTTELDAPCGSRVCPECCKICNEAAEKRGEPCRKVKAHAAV